MLLPCTLQSDVKPPHGTSKLATPLACDEVVGKTLVNTQKRFIQYQKRKERRMLSAYYNLITGTLSQSSFYYSSSQRRTHIT